MTLTLNALEELHTILDEEVIRPDSELLSLYHQIQHELGAFLLDWVKPGMPVNEGRYRNSERSLIVLLFRVGMVLSDAVHFSLQVQSIKPMQYDFRGKL